MKSEREIKSKHTNYGALHMRSVVINGNDINAFYDSSDNLVFVLDNTINVNKPNVLLVIDPDGDRKWDEILSNDYDVDLETIRPKVDNKYQKLDIEYSGLNVYDNLINAYNSGDDLDEELNQLNILRDSAIRHSAMARLNAANEVISKTNATIVKTKETIVQLNERIKTLRAKLSATKKEIGRVSTKQSAARILKLESQIEATNEKLKRAKKRLESAQKRLDVATADAELASAVLNQPSTEIKQMSKPMTTKSNNKNKSVVVEPKHELQEYDDTEEDDADEDFNNSDVKPLFDNDPQILNEDIAFKPISFNAPVVPEITQSEQKLDVPTLPELPEPEKQENTPYLNDVFIAPEIKETEIPVLQPGVEEKTVEKPVLESLSSIDQVPEIKPVPDVPEMVEEKPSVLESMTPVARQYEPVVDEEPETTTKQIPTENKLVAPMTESMRAEIIGEDNKHKPTLTYYLLLIVLITLSVFTLWLYQKNIDKDVTPVLTANVEKTTVLKKTEKPKKTVKPTVATEDIDTVFLDEEQPTKNTVKSESVATVETDDDESLDVADQRKPVVIDAVPARVNYSGADDEETTNTITEDEILANKPVYEPGAKHDAMFVDENPDYVEYYEDSDVIYVDENDPFYDAEEAQYQAEQNDLYYEE